MPKYGLAPITHKQSRILILGSMPGEQSLQQQQYYAHPRNAFWVIMQQLTGIDAQAPYIDRLQGLKNSGIAVWDMIASCQRKGSLYP